MAEFVSCRTNPFVFLSIVDLVLLDRVAYAMVCSINEVRAFAFVVPSTGQDCKTEDSWISWNPTRNPLIHEVVLST